MPADVDLQLSRRLRWRRRLLDLNQADIGGRRGVGFRQIRKYASGLSHMSAAMSWRNANALDVEIGLFFEGVDREHAVGVRPRRRCEPTRPGIDA